MKETRVKQKELLDFWREFDLGLKHEYTNVLGLPPITSALHLLPGVVSLFVYNPDL